MKSNPPVTFRSQVFTRLNRDSFDSNMEKCLSEYFARIEEYERSGSGWVIDTFIHLDLGKQCFYHYHKLL